MTVRVYRRCNSGHYFADACCPLDGWSSPESDAVYVAAQRLIAADVTPSIDRLQAEGVGDHALTRTIVVQFGAAESAFDAVAPEGYVVDGTWRVFPAVPAAFK